MNDDGLKLPQMVGLFLFCGYKICTTLIKEKGVASLRHRVTIRTIRTMITIAEFSVIGMLKNCVALNKEKRVASFKHQVPMRTIKTMNTTASFPITGTLKICVALNKEKDFASFR